MSEPCNEQMPRIATERCGRRKGHAGHHRSERARAARRHSQLLGDYPPGDGLGALRRYAAQGLELPGDTMAERLREKLLSAQG